MKTVRDLMIPPAHIQGRIEAIVVRGAPRERARRVEHTTALAGIGLADDRLGQRGEAELSTGACARYGNRMRCPSKAREQGAKSKLGSSPARLCNAARGLLRDNPSGEGLLGRMASLRALPGREPRLRRTPCPAPVQTLSHRFP